MSVTTERVTSGGLPYRIVGSQKETQTLATLDSSYLEGGEPLPISSLGLNVVEGRPICNIVAGSESEEWVSEAWYTPSDEKIHLASAKTGKEVASTKDMSKVVVLITARGRGGS